MYINYAIKCGDRMEAVLLILFTGMVTINASENASFKQRHIYIYIYIYIQGVPGGMCQTSGECSLC